MNILTTNIFNHSAQNGNAPSNAELAQQIQALTHIIANLANTISAVTQGAIPTAVAPTSLLEKQVLKNRSTTPQNMVHPCMNNEQKH